MTPIQPTIGTERYFLCPCGDTEHHGIDHLKPGGSAGPWHCDSCWVGWFVSIDDAGGVTLTDRGYRSRKIAARVRLQPQKAPIDFIVTAYAHREDGQKPGLGDTGDCEYFYEEHTCPENIMRSVREVVVGDDDDPHGLFEYVECFELEEKTEDRG